MGNTSGKKIVVIGGYGAFGSLISEQLVQAAAVTIAGRNQEKGQNFASSIGADFVVCDTKNRISLQNIIAGAAIVINASGPFLPNDYAIPQVCIEANCHYIDLADNRQYVKQFEQLHDLAKAKEVFACTGASTTPAVTHALVSSLVADVQNLQSIKIYLSAGNKNKAGISTFQSILSYVGVPVLVWSSGQWERFLGWSLSESINFPPPVGRRLVQLCDVPDLELFPKLFEANEVIFKAGVELPVFNLALSILAQLKRRIPQVNLVSLAELLVKISELFRGYGTLSGGVLVRLESDNGTRKSVAFVTSRNGPRLPSSPAVLLAKKILIEGPPKFGAFPCVGFIRLDEFRNFLEPFGFELKSSL